MALFSYRSLCAQDAALVARLQNMQPPRTTIRRFDCPVWQSAMQQVHRTRMIGATPFQAPPGPRSRPHGLNASVWGRGKLAPIIQVAQFTLVRWKVLPFLDCKDARSAGKGKGMEMIHPGHEYAVQAESYPPPGSSYMDRKRTYQK